MRVPDALYGVIEHGAGTQQIHPWEGLDVQPHGIYLHHNDSWDTVTFLPIFTVRMVRYHKVGNASKGPNIPGQENINWLDNIKELESGEDHL